MHPESRVNKILSQKLFYILIFLLPVQLARHFWYNSSLVLGIRIDYLAPTVYLTDCLIILVLLAWGYEQRENIAKIKKFLFSPPFLLSALVFIYLLINAVTALYSLLALYKLAKIIEFTLLSGYIISQKPKLTQLVIPLSVGIYISFLIAFTQFIKQGSIGGLMWFLGERSFTQGTPGIALIDISGRLFLRPYATFPHPNVLGGFLVFALLYCLFFFLRNKKNTVWNKIFFSFTMLIGVFTLILTVSLSAFIALFIGIVVIIFGFSRRKVGIRAKTAVKNSQKGKYVLKIIPVILTFILLSIVATIKISSPNFRKDFVIRSSLNSIAITLWQKNLFLGIGLDNFIPQLSQNRLVQSKLMLQPVHNIFLLVLVETGLIGFFIFLTFIYRGFQKSLKLWQEGIVLPLTLLILIILIGMVDHYFLTLQQGQIISTICFALAFLPKSSYT